MLARGDWVVGAREVNEPVADTMVNSGESCVLR